MNKKTQDIHLLNERKNYIIEAKSLNFLNAVFCIYFYNNVTKSWRNTQKIPDISQSDVFNGYSKKEYEKAITQCSELLKSSLKYGDQALNAVRYNNNEEYQSIRESFHLNHPGFNEKNLERALKFGMTHMR